MWQCNLEPHKRRQPQTEGGIQILLLIELSTHWNMRTRSRRTLHLADRLNPDLPALQGLFLERRLCLSERLCPGLDPLQLAHGRLRSPGPQASAKMVSGSGHAACLLCGVPVPKNVGCLASTNVAATWRLLGRQALQLASKPCCCARLQPHIRRGSLTTESCKWHTA